MIVLILFIFYDFYFYFIYQGHIGQGKPDLHIVLSIPFGLMVIGGVFWGFTTLPHTYSDYWSIQSFLWWSRSEMELLFFFPMCIALALSYFVVYHLGENKGAIEMRDAMRSRES
jgi:hypothetical protein